MIAAFHRPIERFFVGCCGGHDEIPRAHPRNDGSRVYARRLVEIDAPVLWDGARADVERPRCRAGVARVKHDDGAAGFQACEDRIQLVVHNVRNPWAAAVHRHDGLIQAIFFISIQVLHLRPVTGVVEVHRVVRAGGAHQLFERSENSGTRRGLVSHHPDVRLLKTPARDEHFAHGLHVVHRALQPRNGFVVVDADQQGALRCRRGHRGTLRKCGRQPAQPGHQQEPGPESVRSTPPVHGVACSAELTSSGWPRSAASCRAIRAGSVAGTSMM